MREQLLRYTASGHAFLEPGDDAEALVDALLGSGYSEDFCLALSFDPAFIAALMSAGFLVMAMRLDETGASPILLPKFHLDRSILDFKELHESRSARRLLARYTLKYDCDFDRILDRCVEVHGDDWLIPELTGAFRSIRSGRFGSRMTSFALYREDRLVAGEFGVTVGGVYTSYSGYRDESSAGTVQLILTARHLRETGYRFWDLGMPIDYKESLGARIIDRSEFLDRFRDARKAPQSDPAGPLAP